MGFYLEMSCGAATCGFSATLGNGTEFYIDDQGRELTYGHPVCFSPEAQRCGIGGFWRELLCWECGHLETESLRLNGACHNEALAWMLFPSPDVSRHPRSCPACSGILCSISMIQMFLGYRADPEAARRQLREQSVELQKRKDSPPELDPFGGFLHEHMAELEERNGDPVTRIQEELKDIEAVQSEEEMILHRLGLPPVLPVSKESILRLRDCVVSAHEAAELLRVDMFAKMEAARPPARLGVVDGGAPGHLQGGTLPTGLDEFSRMLFSPLMKAKRALDHQLEDICKLRTHLWVAERLVADEQGTFGMFRARCPRCRTEGLVVGSYMT